MIEMTPTNGRTPYEEASEPMTSVLIVEDAALGALTEGTTL